MLIEAFKIDSIFKNYIEKCDYFDGSVYEIVWITKEKDGITAKSISGKLCVGYFYKDSQKHSN